MIHSPFDQPEYGSGKAGAKKKRAAPKKTAAPKRPTKVSKKAKKARKKPATKRARPRAAAPNKAATGSPAPGLVDLPEWEGVSKDLWVLVKILNDRYFSRLPEFGKKAVVVEKLKWGRTAASRHGTCTYHVGGPLAGQVSIIVNGQLGPDSVPVAVTAFTLYHEMVHAYCFKTGETICRKHDTAFRKRERLFKGWQKVKAWRKKGLYSEGCAGTEFRVGQEMRGHGLLADGRRLYVTGCVRDWVMLADDAGKVFKIRKHLAASILKEAKKRANPTIQPVLPELEDDTRVLVWED